MSKKSVEERVDALMDSYGGYYFTSPMIIKKQRTDNGKPRNFTAHGDFAKIQSSRMKRIKKSITKNIETLERLQNGSVIFEIDGFKFTIGTRNSGPIPSYDDLPAKFRAREARLFFHIPGMDSQTTRDDVETELGITENIGYFIQITRLNKTIDDSTRILAERKTNLPIRLIDPQIIQQVRNFEVAKRVYRASIAIRHLVQFAKQIEDEHPAVAMALRIVFLGPQIGSTIQCPVTKQIAEIASKPLKKGQKLPDLIKQMTGSLGQYKSSTKGFKLRDYQLIGVAFWASAGGRAMIADDMGIGKTITAIGAVILSMMKHKISKKQKNKIVKQQNPNPFPILIVCPKSGLYMWEEEMKEWIPNCNPMVLHGKDIEKLGSKKLPKNSVIITTYTSMSKYAEVFSWLGIQFMILDESQRVKNPGSKRTKAAIHIAKNCRFIAELSGSPMEKSIEDLWSQMHILNPSAFPTMEGFVQAMESAKYNEKTQEIDVTIPHVTSIKDGRSVLSQHYSITDGNKFLLKPSLVESGGQLFEPLRCLMIRRNKSQVLTELPAKTRKFIHEKLDKRAEKLYLSAELESEKRLASLRINKWCERIAKNALKLMKSGEIINATDAINKALKEEPVQSINEMKVNALSIFTGLKRQMGLLRTQMVLNWVKDHFEDHKRPLLIFAEQLEVIRQLVNGIGKMTNQDGQKLRVASYTGKLSATNRREVEKDFQNGKIDVLVLNLAGNVGLNLQNADQVLFAERYWNPSDEIQGEDRAYRNGKKEPVTVYYFHIPEFEITKEQYEMLGGSEKSKNVRKDGNKYYSITIDDRVSQIIERKRTDMEDVIGLDSFKSQTRKQKRLSGDAMDLLNKSFSRINQKELLNTFVETMHDAGIKYDASQIKLKGVENVAKQFQKSLKQGKRQQKKQTKKQQKRK